MPDNDYDDAKLCYSVWKDRYDDKNYIFPWVSWVKLDKTVKKFWYDLIIFAKDNYDNIFSNSLVYSKWRKFYNKIVYTKYPDWDDLGESDILFWHEFNNILFNTILDIISSETSNEKEKPLLNEAE